MSLVVFVLIAVADVSVLAAVAAVSFRVGRSRGFGEIFHIRMEAARARRQMHDLTRKAFVAMTEIAESHGRSGDGSGTP